MQRDFFLIRYKAALFHVFIQFSFHSSVKFRGKHFYRRGCHFDSPYSNRHTICYIANMPGSNNYHAPFLNAFCCWGKKLLYWPYWAPAVPHPHETVPQEHPPVQEFLIASIVWFSGLKFFLSFFIRESSFLLFQYRRMEDIIRTAESYLYFFRQLVQAIRLWFFNKECTKNIAINGNC